MRIEVAKTALGVIDMQHKYLVRKGDDTSEALSNARSLVELARSEGMFVFFTKMPRDYGFHRELVPLKDELVIVKSKYDAFHGTELDDSLRRAGIDAVLLCGLYTDICVQRTAIGAVEKGYAVGITEDCCYPVNSARDTNELKWDHERERYGKVEIMRLENIRDLLAAKRND